MSNVYKFKFNVRGKVQGVFFRKYTKLEADKLGIKGYVRNEEDGSVSGEGQTDDEAKMNQFKHFLESVGSPNSEIESCSFTLDSSSASSYDSFNILY
ncbi:Acylphosphatase-2 [Theileria parva strain Muguga]|uniref:acylphosphatase n=1 Tax=Theileria parva TaxID=5875 RepID=Q4N6M9_THEPA|nr:Acylphosphatase-2 [Theileria parva strain Muguga]EAN34379.1 Acylphosphatase-2 [Theileria parva strain Muguga]|eukprot:XP_766662.1 acylphosphatase [Theileria parva strain Muguga]